MMASWSDITFASPWAFWLLLLLPLALFWVLYFENKRTASVQFSQATLLKGIESLKGAWTRFLPYAMRSVAFVLIVFALARPQSNLSWQDQSTEGIDIMLALDISSSMLATDFKPNRIEASKKVAIEFIEKRINDRMGLVVYAGESFTQCPLTTDHDVVKNLFSGIKTGLVQDGTAIGYGLATAVTRLKKSEAKSKVIILLTDGENNSGSIPPLTAAEIAKTFNIRVYTIGVGSIGEAMVPVGMVNGQYVMGKRPVRIDEETLTQIAQKTDGRYFRATDMDKLKEVYEEIDTLEKSKIEVTEYRKKKEEFLPYLLLAMGILVLEFILGKTLLKSAIQ